MTIFFLRLYLFSQQSEPVGVLVLERCAVELDAHEEHEFTFILREF